MKTLKQVVSSYVKGIQKDETADDESVSLVLTQVIVEEVKKEIIFDEKKQLLAKAQEEADNILKRAQRDAAKIRSDCEEEMAKEERKFRNGRIRKLIIEAIFLAIGTGVIANQANSLLPVFPWSPYVFIIIGLLICILYVLSQTKE